VSGVFANLVAGAWIASSNAVPDINPSDTSDIVGRYAAGDASTVDAAVAAARAAFAGWASASPQARFDVLDRAGDEILRRREELGELLAREEGKTRAEGIGEAVRAGYIFKFFAGEALRAGGETLASVRPNISVELLREPIGVVGLITPWNFPLAIPAWKIAPALAYGNCVVFKPAELVPACAWAIADILVRAGVPAGVFNLVMGPGRVVGRAIVATAGIDAISFTGSTATGRGILSEASARGARVQLEMGGKNPLVVLDDADLTVAVDCAVQGAFFSTGQRCTASSRLIVTSGIHDAFVEAMVAKLATLRVGHALAADTQIGPVVDAGQLAQNESYLDLGHAEGAQLAFGGERIERETVGYFQQPALWVNTRADMRVMREEIFGPIAGVLKVADYDEALAAANDTEFGLCSGIVTRSLHAAYDFKRRSQAGMIMVNLPTAGVDYHVPFGGRKSSSYGPKEQGTYACEFYTTLKTAYIAP